MLTTGEVGVLFDVSAQTIINWLEEGRLHYERHRNGPRKVHEQDVFDYVNSEQISTKILNPEIWALVLKKINSSRQNPIIVIDKNMDILSWNLGCSQEFGIVQEECSGKRLGSVLPIQIKSSSNKQEESIDSYSSKLKSLEGCHGFTAKLQEKELTGIFSVTPFFSCSNEFSGCLLYFSQVTSS